MISIRQISKSILICGGFVILLLCNAGCMAPQLAEEPIPSDFATFSYNSRGGPGADEYNCFIDFNKRELTTKISRISWEEFSEEEKSRYGKKTIRLSSEQITMLRQAFHKAQLLRWGPKYTPEHWMLDGTFWTLKYTLADGTSRTIEGDNAWPYHMRYIVKAIKSTGAEFMY